MDADLWISYSLENSSESTMPQERTEGENNAGNNCHLLCFALNRWVARFSRIAVEVLSGETAQLLLKSFLSYIPILDNISKL